MRGLSLQSPSDSVMPALAAWFPGDVRNNFALLNWLAVAGAACAVALAVSRMVVSLAVLGWRNAPAQLRPLKSLLLLLALPPLYAALCVRVDGRAIWGLYPMLIPFALSLGLTRRA